MNFFKKLAAKKNKILFYLFFLSVFLLIFIRLSLPFVFEKILERRADKKLGRQIKIEKISFNLFAGEITIKNGVIFEEDAKSVFFSVAELSGKINWRKTIKRGFYMDFITAVKPSINISKIGEDYKIDDEFIKKIKELVKEDEDEKKKKTYFYNNLKLFSGQVNFIEDTAVYSIILDADIPFIDAADSNMQIKLKLTAFESAVEFYATADYNRKSRDFDCLIKNALINIDQLKSLAASRFNSKKINIAGKIKPALRISGNTKQLEKTSINGAFDLMDFQISNNDSQPLVSFDTLKAVIKNIDFENKQIHITKILLNKPFVKFERFKNKTNFPELFQKKAETIFNTQKNALNETSSVAASDTKFVILIDSLNIDTGAIHYNDYRFDKQFKYSIDRINAVFTNISSAKINNLKFKIDALLNNRGQFNGYGSLSLTVKKNWDIDAFARIRNTALRDFNVFTERYIGHSVKSGSLNLSNRLKLKNNFIDISASLRILSLSLGNRIIGITPEFNSPVPLEMAVEILKDKNGAIVFNAPIKGNLNNPNFSISAELTDAAKKFLLSSMNLPFRFF